MLELNRLRVLRKAGRVKRFHTRDVIIPDNVATHSFNMVMTMILMGDYTDNMLHYALLHDMGERHTGDIPSPIKRKIKEETNVVELEEVEWLSRHLPVSKLAEFELTVEELELVKVCDNLDGLVKCIEEVELGNGDLVEVGHVYCKYLSGHKDILLVRESIKHFKELTNGRK